MATPTQPELDELVPVRYIVDDVQAAIDFYTTHLGFTLRNNATPAYADVTRGHLRLQLSGPSSSAGGPMPDGRVPEPGGWNRIQLAVDDLDAEVQRLRTAGAHFRNDITEGRGGRQILLDDPAGNPIGLFQPANQLESPTPAADPSPRNSWGSLTDGPPDGPSTTRSSEADDSTRRGAASSSRWRRRP